AEFLVRLQGVEKPSEVGQQFEARPSKLRREQRQLLLFMSTLVSLSMRFATDPLSVGNIDLITEQYKHTSDGIGQQMPTLNALIRSLNRQVSWFTLQAS